MRTFLSTTLVLGIVLHLTACDNNWIQGEYVVNNDANKKWEQQFRPVMENKTRSLSDYLVFVGYTEKGEITSVGKLKDAVELLFSDDMCMAFQNIADYSFVIKPIGDVCILTDNFSELKSEILAESSNNLLNGMTLRLLELEWIFKGKTCLSRAIVTDEEGVLFETIGHLIVMKGSTLSVNSVKTRNEISNENLDGNPFKRTFTKRSLWTTVVSCSVYCQSEFSAGVLIDKDMQYNHSASLGYSCSAEIKTIKGEINKDTYHEFAWAYAYKKGTGLSLTWNGAGFTITGGGSGEGGTKVHRN